MKHYTLQRKSYLEVISDNFSETLKNFGCFVGCLATSGITWGIIRNMNLAMDNVKDDNVNIVPIFFGISSVCFAKKMFDSYKKERKRFHELSLEIDKEREKRRLERQKSMSGFATPEQVFNIETQKLFDKGEKVVELKKYQDILNGENVQETSGATQGKRKSLNNGIFKSNDIY